MANKRVKEKRTADNKLAAYEKERSVFLPFYIISAAIAAVAILFFFLKLGICRQYRLRYRS